MADKIDTKITKLKESYPALFKSAPIDVVALIEKLNISYNEEPLDDGWSGFCVHPVDGEQQAVVVNSSDGINRQRFTSAHELGHLQLHCDNSSEDLFIDKKIYHRDSKSSTGDYKKEVEANQFAARLLMPKDLLTKDAAVMIEDEKGVENLAKKYNVSEQAMCFRLSKLGFFVE